MSFLKKIKKGVSEIEDLPAILAGSGVDMSLEEAMPIGLLGLLAKNKKSKRVEDEEETDAKVPVTKIVEVTKVKTPGDDVDDIEAFMKQRKTKKRSSFI